MSIPNSPRRTRVGVVLILTVLIALALTLAVCADNYVGRYDGNVSWSFDTDTGELRLYANCGMQTPLWSGFADRIRSVYIAPGVTQLPRDAFRGCTGVREIVIPSTVTTIGAYAFEGCSSLVTLVLPSSLIYVGEHVLEHCPSLTYVTYQGSSQEWERLCAQAAGVSGNEWLCNTTPVYTRRIYFVTVRFISAETGVELASPIERTVTVGADCTVLCPTVEHHSPQESAVTLRDVQANQTVSVLYYRTHCEVGVRYVDELDNALLPDAKLTVAQGSSLLLQAPEIEGYVPPEQSEVVLTGVVQNDLIYTFRYTRRTVSVCVRCVDELGQELCEPLISNVPYGQGYEIPLPDVDGYAAPMEAVRGSELRQDTAQTVTYLPVYHTVTLRYLDEEGNELATSDTVRVRHGQPLTHALKSILGYRTPQDITLSSVTAERTVDTVYRPADYLLTVQHRGVDGTLLQTTDQRVAYGESYRCLPLALEGFEPEALQSEQLNGVMGAAPMTLVIYYHPVSSVVEGGGNDSAPQTNPSLATLLMLAVGVAAVLLVALTLLLIRDVRRRRAATK